MSIHKKLGLMIMLMLMFTYTVQPLLQASAAPDDGTYSVDYVVKKAEDESVSMANDYFEKPAELTVSGGTVKARLQLNHSEWITDFQVPNGNAKVLRSNKTADTRVVEFEVKDIEKPVIAKIHVTVPSIDYDHDYTIRIEFAAGELKAAAPVVKKPTSTPVPTKKPAAAPGATKKPAVTTSPTKKPTSTTSPTKKPTSTPVPTKKPAAAPVATKKPATAPVATKKPAATPVPTKKPAATPAATKKPTATPVPTKKPTAAADSTAAPVAVVTEQEAPKLKKTLLGSGAAVLVAAAGYAVYRARKK